MQKQRKLSNKQRRNRRKGQIVRANTKDFLVSKRKADLKRVLLDEQKGLLPPPVACDSCGRDTVTYTTYNQWPDTSERAAWSRWGDNRLYGCSACGARVGVHKGTNNPLGYMADRETRTARRACKPVFIEATQVVFHGNKNKAYAWLSKVMGLPPSKTHWAMFNATQCHEARDHTLSLLFDEDSYK